jgi:sulfate adenylyltransferase large subunit
MAAAPSATTLPLDHFLAQPGERPLLRFFTAGSVDDGKSTLIGRLLFDTKGAYDDQIEAVKKSKVNRAGEGLIDYSLLTDGLRAEREQGITIDVAYRYFATPRRKFIIADTPGHEQYTRNMATGASNCEAAVILIDARNGVVAQSRRHAFIASLLGIRHFAVAVNKMDLVGWSREVYEEIRNEFTALSGRLGSPEMTFIPVSALEGGNVVERSERMRWHDGPTLLEWLETVEPQTASESNAFRMPVQFVIRPGADFRGFAGQITSGRIAVGDQIAVLPSGRSSRVSRIVTFDGELEEAFAPMSVTLALEDEIDISRGDLLATPAAQPQTSRHLEASVVWMSHEPLEPGRPYLLLQGPNAVTARIGTVLDRTDVEKLERRPASALGLNDIGRVTVEAVRPIAFDPYQADRRTGAFVLVDPISNATVAAGMIQGANEAAGRRRQTGEFRPEPVTSAERAARYGHRGALIAMAGRPGAADLLERLLFEHGCLAVRLRRAAGDVQQLVEQGLLVVSDAPELGAAPRDLPAGDEAAARQMMKALESAGVLFGAGFELGEGI